MPDAAIRPSRIRLFLYVSLVLTIAMALLVGWMLHWDDQLKLYWQEQYIDSQERAASIWLPDYELALETKLFGLEDDETSGLTWNAATGTLFTVTGQNPQLVEFSPEIGRAHV